MGKRILFTGDSITDGNRYKAESERWDLNHQMGHSYAYILNGLLGSLYPERDFHFLNRGISGNRIPDLYSRIYEDMIALKPDIVSILIGINDGPQRTLDSHATGRKKYGSLYRQMLNELKEALPDVKLIIMEPFLGVNGPANDDNHKLWDSYITEYRQEARAVAEEFKAVFVPLQDCFNEASRKSSPEYWIWDGIHPTENGHGLIARQWLIHAGKLLDLPDSDILRIH